MDEGVELLRLAKGAHRSFEKQPAKEKSRMLNFLLSNCSWTNGELSADFKQPFDLLAETAMIASNHDAHNVRPDAIFEKWLPFVNAYRTLYQAPEAEFLVFLQEIGVS